MTQPTLWDDPGDSLREWEVGPFGYVTPRARRSDPDTSHAAADSMREGAAIQRRRVLQALEDAGGSLTADEIDATVGWRATTAGRRLAELERAGLVRPTGTTRPTRSGRQAREYRITWDGCRTLRTP